MAKVARGASRDIMSVDVGVTKTSTLQLTSRERSKLQSGLRPETDFKICKTSDRPNTKYAYYSCLSTATVTYCVNQLQCPVRPSKNFSSCQPSLFFQAAILTTFDFQERVHRRKLVPPEYSAAVVLWTILTTPLYLAIVGIDGAETYPIKRRLIE